MADIQDREIISFESSRKNIPDETIDFDVNRLAPGAYFTQIVYRGGYQEL